MPGKIAAIRIKIRYQRINTNYENQKQHIKNAGLNPALMYGMGGGGGISANGAPE